ncbi:ketosteroid isomerase-like protein [Caulobacter ginsengisoli]|uniref:Ketosteroid isomerase-like protein n=1 Tax=Caulobacter ginsengisoli TaxID=400775 RepID=A0ABU0IVW5_9CAUL|nr:nuclear transport factor 2 family protein [Caulobacter ginsengisoli]MDQ0466161.1 ketosteroid isomerase-like protein [Caulobacter ginsengisoli]
MSNIARIREAYEAWDNVKGSNRAVWDHLLAPGFEFRTTLGSVEGSGFKASYRPDELDEYFETLRSNFEMKEIAPTVVVEDGPNAIAVFQSEWANRATGRSFRCEVAAIWTFDGDQAVSCREIMDTAGVACTLP